MKSKLRTTAGLAESDACGGGVRPNEPRGVGVAASNEAGKPTCEGRSPLGSPMGRCQSRAIGYGLGESRTERPVHIRLLLPISRQVISAFIASPSLILV
jgi:hypothetical protein